MREEFETQFCHKMTANPKMFFMDSNAGVGSIEAFIEHYMDLAMDIPMAKKGEYGRKMYDMGFKEGVGQGFEKAFEEYNLKNQL
jgi:hypothetical protein